MEAVPRLPMLSFDLRQSAEPADFGPKIKQFIRNHYNEDPESFGNEINQLEGLRSSAVRPLRDVTGCSTLKRYYCQLHFLSSRFPMYKDGEAAVMFSWKQLSGNSTNSSSDIVLEMSSILYNIGALHSQLGAADNRTTPDGMKMSCTHFQCAAWAFQHICEEYAQSSGLDLSLDLMSFMAKLCLGQAQECILEKSMMDNRKATIIAKVSIQTVEYYKQALKIILDNSDEGSMTVSIGSKCCKKFEKYLKFKISYHGSIALLFQGQQAEEQQKMGERIAFYQASFDKLDEARKLAKGLDNAEAINEALTFVHDVVEGKRKAAKNENEFIYHEDVPDVNTLPDVKGASLVKGIPFNINDIEVSGPDIFCRIVPMEAHEASSLYSEEKAKLLRRVVALIENKDEELETFLSTLELDDLMKPETNKLPQELIDRCAALSAKPDAIKNLVDSMVKLSSIYHDVESMLTEIDELLNEEEIHEKEYQETVGKRPPSIAATDLTREAKKYQEAHTKASGSNQTLQKAMVLHTGNMKLLSLPPKELINHIPPIIERPEVEAVMNEMRHLLDKVNEMKKQRVMLSDRLRESIYQDDILRQVVTYTGENIQTLFDSELQKHQRTVALIEQNLAAQENILKAVKDAYARYGATRKGTSEMHKRREMMIASLIASYDAYEDLLAKSAKGLDFYKKLEVNVSKLLQRVKGTCKVQDEEREQIIRNVKNSECHEVNPTPVLKLKDYLDMKKEFGKLSLENATHPPANPYYNKSASDQVAASQSWIPGVRPAPVGSEETDANSMNRIDSFPGMYNTQAREQTWNGATSYSNNQSIDDRMKYYVPQVSSASETSRIYSTETNSQCMAHDIYPISAYSSVMQNTSSTGYTGPKSNYYNTQNSPSRYINPPHFYTDYNQPVITSCGTSASVPSTSTHSSSKTVNESTTPSPYNALTSVGSGYTYSQQAPSQTISSGCVPIGYSINQPEVLPANYISNTQAGVYQYAVPGNSNPTDQVQPPVARYKSYTSDNVDPYAVAGATQNTALSSQLDYNNQCVNSTVVSGNNSLSTQLPNYAPIVNYNSSATTTQSAPANYTSAQENPYVTPTSYQTSTAYVIPVNPTISSYYTVDASSINISSSYDYSSSLSCPTAQTYSQSEASKLQDNYSRLSNEYAASHYSEGNNPPVFNTSWQQSYAPSTSLSTAYANNPGQHLQSGNESLYTACQSNSYALTNSEVYKNLDFQNTNVNYPTQPANYPNHYYVNQYGACNGQNEFGSTSGNSVTYMQAGTDNQQATTVTTYSNNDTKSSPSTEHSNVDLLAGLDFSVNQSPLIPESSSPAVKVSINAKIAKNETNGEREETKTEATTAKEEKITGTSTDLKLSRQPSQETTPNKDLFVDVEKLNQFGQEVEKYEKFVESLTLKTLNGPTCLDLKWKEISELQDKSSHHHIISVARCYPMKNRFPDILPYDDSRVELPSTKDDYINASLVKNLSQFTPNFILTQAPLPSTYSDFWTMVFEQQVEIIICLLSDPELEGHVYWPTEKGQELVMGKLKITLQSSNVKPHWIERIVSLCVMETRVTRVVVQLQFTSWPGSSFPESPGPFLSFASECINYFHQQRSSSHPVVVHCISGVGRTGLFCLIVAAILDIQAGKAIPDLVAITDRMSQFRKSSLRDREHLKFAYQAILYYCQDLLMKRGILTNRSGFDDKKLKEGKCHTRHPSEDFLLGPSTDLNQLQSGIEKLGFECSGVKNEVDLRSASGRSQSSCSRRDSVTSSGRSSPSSVSSDVLLSTLDPANFSLKMDPNRSKKNAKKRYTTESFSAKKSELSLDAFNSESDDPLSRLDPLWTMKK